MARLIFHELAHQEIYVQDDSAFNEAFATAVELEGAKRWINRYGNPQLQQQLQQSEQGRELFQGLLTQTRQQLEALYAQPLPVEEKRRQKAQQLEALALSYQQLKQHRPDAGGYDHWFQPLPNNAHFVSLATYHRLVPAFQALLQQADNNWARFYQQVKQLARQPRAEREQQLQALLDSGKRP
jgi:predicted aminopeptidase